MATFVLVLQLISALSYIIVIWRAAQESLLWGLFFFIGSPLVYYFLAKPLGPLLSLGIVAAAHLYYVATRWSKVGIAYVVAFVCFVAAHFMSPTPLI